MSELDLQDAFRQLALDLGAADDDVDRRSIELSREGKEITIGFRAYKALLEIRVANSGSKQRPAVVVHRTNAVDRLGREFGVDEKPAIDDEAFWMRFDLVSEAPSKALAALFGPKAARDAAIDLDELGILPVWINGEAVGMHETAGTGDLAHERIAGILSALGRFEDALGTWSEDGLAPRQRDRHARRDRRRGIDRHVLRVAPCALGNAKRFPPLRRPNDRRHRNPVAHTFLGAARVQPRVRRVTRRIRHRARRSTVEKDPRGNGVPPRGRCSHSRHSDPRALGKSFRVLVHDGRLGWAWVEYAD